MNIPDDSTGVLETIFKVVCAAFAGLAGWLWSGVVGDIKDVQKNLTELTKEHADHRIYVEREFEKRSTIQLSLARIHDRLDQLVQLMAEKNK